MKLVTYRKNQSPGPEPEDARPGVYVDGRILDIQMALGTKLSMLGLIEDNQRVMPTLRQILAQQSAAGQSAKEWLTEGDVTLLAPIPRPLSMRDGYAFRQHVEAARRNRGLPMIPEFDLFPIFYYTNHLSVVGPGPVYVRKGHLDKLDFELEAAVVLGKSGRDLSVQEADRAIFGLMVMNDWSARGMQMEEMKLNLGPAKGKDFATALGPYLVPVEDLAAKIRRTDKGSLFDLAMTCRVNGEEVAAGNLGDMSYTFAEIISRMSYGVQLSPGEVVGSGTVGTGCFLETNGSGRFQNRWLGVSDQVECSIEELGCLTNTVVLREPGSMS